MNRRRFCLGGGSLVAAVVLWWWICDPLEPRFSGQRDSEFVLRLFEVREIGPDQLTALRQLGDERATRAICTVLRRQKASWSEKLWRWGYEHPRYASLAERAEPLRLRLDSHPKGQKMGWIDIRRNCLVALGALGPGAAAAVPDLRRLVDSDRDDLAAESLGKIGPPAVPALPSLQAAASSGMNLWRLRTFVTAMHRIQPGSADFALGRTVPEITSTNERIRAIAVEVLGEIGPAARGALPQIRAMQNDEWKMVRDAVAGAIPKIDRPQ